MPMTLDEQIENMETYIQDEHNLASVCGMIVKNTMAHSAIEERLAKDLLHAYECLWMRDKFLVDTGAFNDFSKTVTS